MTSHIDERSAAPAAADSVASRVLTGAFVVLAIGSLIQFALAGGAAFGTGSWSMHQTIGMALELVALVTLIVAFLAREGRQAIVVALVAFALVSLQPVFAVLATRQDPSFGYLHGIVGALLLVHVTGVGLQRIRRSRAATVA